MSIAVGLISFVVSLVLASCYRWPTIRLPLPPGPKGYPVIGNLFDMPFEQQWVRYRKWCKEYSKLRNKSVQFSANVIV